ncbi:MAG TPA: beta-N-acetylhexosaminidase [Tepidisphaeraceae bacterium]|nr:beta-N-acetylhexosaminidase [Tepidisphaeraceae bacterium]
MENLTAQVAKMFCVGFDGHQPTQELRDLLAMGVQHVILFGRNVAGAQQVFDLTSQVKRLANRPTLIGIDQEGGRVRRLVDDPFTAIPPMRSVGQTGEEKIAREVGRTFGRELRSVNIDVDFAPVLDVDTNPDNPVIAHRSFGGDPALVARLGCAVIAGLQENGVAACAKHFPGHGDTHLDSHLDLPRISHDMNRLNSVEFSPFKAAIDAGVASMMSAHIIVEALDADFPATLSRPALEDLARGRFGFDGVIYSDSFEMKAIANHYGFEDAIVRGILAGCDVILLCHTPALQIKGIETAIRAVERGQIPRERIEQSGKRIDKIIADYFRAPPERYTAVPPNAELVEKIAQRSMSELPEKADPTENVKGNR